MKQLDFSTLKINEIKHLITKEKDKALREKLINEMISDISVFINEIQNKEVFYYELISIENRIIKGEFPFLEKGDITDNKTKCKNILNVYQNRELRNNLTNNSYSFNQFAVYMIFRAFNQNAKELLENYYSLFSDKTYFDTFYNKEIEPEKKRLTGIKAYLESEIILNQKSEQSNTEPKQNIKPLNKFTFNNDISEENIVLLFNLLNQTGFISDKDFKNLGIILQDTFLNSKGNPYKNGQINKVKNIALEIKKLTKKKNLNLLNLYNELKKLIPD